MIPAKGTIPFHIDSAADSQPCLYSTPNQLRSVHPPIRRDDIGCYPQESALKEAHNGTQRCPSQDGVLPFAFERRPAVAVASRVPGSVDRN